MRIGIKATQIVEGGGQKHLEKLLAFYPQEKGTRLVVFLSERQRGFDLPTRDDIDYRYYDDPGNGLFKRLIFEQITLRRLIREEAIDLLFEPGNLGMISRRIPRVMLIHNLAPFSNRFIKGEPWSSKIRLHLLRLATGMSSRRSRGLIHLTNFARDYVKGSIRIERVPQKVIYMGSESEPGSLIEGDEIRQRFGVEGELIFCCSHFYRYKNIMELVKAFRLLRQNQKRPMTLVIAGEHYDREYRNEICSFIESADMIDSVRLTGSLDSVTLRSLYRTCDLFVFPSALESASLILLEALQAGAPIAASDNELCREVLGDAAVFFDSNDPERIEHTIAEALSSRPGLSELQERAIARSKEFSWLKTANETDRFICEIMSVVRPAQMGRKRAVLKRTPGEISRESARHQLLEKNQ